MAKKPTAEKRLNVMVVDGKTYPVPGPYFPDGSPNFSRDEALRVLAFFEYAANRFCVGHVSQEERDRCVLNFAIGFLTGAVKGDR